MLIGKFRNSVDSKNRIFIPHKFRGDLGAKCILSKDLLDNCLNLYSSSQWEMFTKKIEELPTIKMKRMRQFVYSNSCEVEIDSQGRIVLNEKFCEDAGVDLLKEKEVMIIGINTYAQIWNISEWLEFDKKLKAGDDKETMINDLMDIGF